MASNFWPGWNILKTVVNFSVYHISDAATCDRMYFLSCSHKRHYPAMGNFLSPSANVRAYRQLVCELESILELSSDDSAPLLMANEYSVKEVVIEGSACLWLSIQYTCTAGMERSREAQALEKYIVDTCAMCLSLAGTNYFRGGGYEIRIMRVVDDEVRELHELHVVECK